MRKGKPPPLRSPYEQKFFTLGGDYFPLNIEFYSHFFPEMLSVVAFVTHKFKIVKIKRDIGIVYILWCDMHLVMYYVARCSMAMLTHSAVNHRSAAYERLSALLPFL